MDSFSENLLNPIVIEQKEMKILLFHKGNKKDIDCTSENEQEQNETSIGLVSIFGLLKENEFDVELMNLSNFDWIEIEEILKEKLHCGKEPTVVGIGCYTKNRFTVLKLAELVKQINPQTKVVLGGPHATHLFEQILTHYKSVDVIVIGEGEETILELMGRIRNNEKIDGVKGIAFRNMVNTEEGKEEIVKTETREPIHNLDRLPIATKYYPSKNIMTSRGCPGNCIFCCTPKLWGRKLRFRSAEDVVGEMQLMAEKGITDIYIADDTFTVDKQRVIDICKEILKRNLKITWYCNARVNFVCEERLYWMKKAGCTRISYGIESGSPRMLKNLQKYISVEQILNASKLTRKFGIHLRFYLIVGTPEETEETINESIELIAKAKPNWVTVCIMTIFPGTQLFEWVKEKFGLSDSIWLDHQEDLYYDYELPFEKLSEFADRIQDYFDSKEKEFDFSIEERKKFIEMFPENGLVHLELAETYSNHGMFDQAIDIFRKSLPLGVNQAAVNAGIALAYSGKGNYQEAIDFSRKALSDDKRLNGLAYKILGKSHFRLGEREKAVEYLKKALEFDPTNEKLKLFIEKHSKSLKEIDTKDKEENNVSYSYSVSYK